MPPDRGTALSACSNDKDYHRDVANSPALVHRKGRCPSDAVLGGAGILARHYFCKFQSLRSAQSSCDRCIAHLCAVSYWSNLLDFGVESALWRADADT